MINLEKGKLIGILGGTFDPIHLGHLRLAEQVYQELSVAEIRFIPCAQSPFKNKPQATDEQRLAMLELALTNISYAKIDDCEIKRSGFSYTVDTLKMLREKLGNEIILSLIMAEDAFLHFDNWHKWSEILQLAHLIVANRPTKKTLTDSIKAILTQHETLDKTALLQNKVGVIYRLPIAPNQISASKIRKLIREGKDVAEFLPAKVWQYIKCHEIYPLDFKMLARRKRSKQRSIVNPM